MHWRNLMLGLAAAAVPVLAHAAAAPAGDAAKGSALFKQRCSVCHSIVDDTGPRPAPSLKGVVGRPAGSIPAFKYSPALKASKLKWDRASLDKFLTAPGTMVPGTFMVISLPNAAEREDVLAYLATLKN
jgi:cytochrome c2